MREIKLFVDEFAWLYLTLKKDGEFIDILCLENFEKDENLLKCFRLDKNLQKVNKILDKIPYDKLTVESEYPPYSADFIRYFVTYPEGSLYE